MSLIKNIGIGKEVFNPFHYACKDHSWLYSLKEHNLFPTKEILKHDVEVFLVGDNFNNVMDLTVIVYGLSAYQMSVYFKSLDKEIEIHGNLLIKPYIKYLKSLYPDAKVTWSRKDMPNNYIRFRIKY